MIMDVKKIVGKLKRSRDKLLSDETLSEEDRKLLMCLNLDDDVEKNIITLRQLLSGKNQDLSSLTDEQHGKLRLMERSGTGSRSIH